MQRHILGTRFLESPYKIIAGDVNRDNKLNGIDLVETRRLVLEEIDSFSNSQSWRFVEEDFVFINAMNPFPFDELIVLNDLQATMLNNNFIGVKLGDVDNTVDLSLVGTDIRSRSRFDIYYSLSAMSTEHETLIPVFSNEQGLIYGFQFALNVDGGQIVEILPGSVDLSDEHISYRGENEVALSWSSVEGAVSNQSIPLFYLSLKDVTNKDVKVSLLKKHPLAEVYQGIDITTKVPSLSLYDEEGHGQFVLYQNEPNPFKDWTEISFYLPEAQEVDLSFFTSEGAKVYGIIKEFEAGQNTVRITADDLGVSNVVVYRLSCDLYHDSKKMIIVLSLIHI